MIFLLNNFKKFCMKPCCETSGTITGFMVVMHEAQTIGFISLSIFLLTWDDSVHVPDTSQSGSIVFSYFPIIGLLDPLLSNSHVVVSTLNSPQSMPF